MGGGSKKFAPLNLNDIYGKKEVKSKLPTLIKKKRRKSFLVEECLFSQHRDQITHSL